MSGERLRQEREDLALLAVAVALVPLTWRVLLSWSPALSVSGHDAMATVIPVLAELVAAGGDWTSLVYRADLLGGMKVRDAVGPFPPFGWLATLGFDTTSVYNLSTFLVQSLLSFLGVRASSDLARAWTGRALPWIARAAGVWFLAFAPWLGWRIGYGHLTLVVGLLPFLAALSLLVAASTARLTLTLSAAAMLALFMGILFTGHQLVLYGAVFGAPILLGAWFSLGRRPIGLLAPAVACVVALGLALPYFLPVVAHARSTDSARSLGHTQITYGYLVPRAVDWMCSIPWMRAAIPAGQPDLHHHETNVPLGPLLLVLALLPWRRARGLGIGLLASAFLAVVFSMNIRPFSSALLALVPPLGSFRVPTRALLPFALSLPVLALAASALRPERAAPRVIALGALSGLALWWLPPGLREAVGWGLAAVLVARRQGQPLVSALPTAGVLCALAAGGLASFRERLLPFPHPGTILTAAQDMGRRLKTARPELASPLVRVSLGFQVPELGPNTAFASGLSALDGYYFPSRRFTELFFALRGHAYEPSAVLLSFPANEPWTRPAFALYNVGWFLERTAAGVQGQRLRKTAGGAWFSQGFTSVASFAALGRVLIDTGEALPDRLHERLWLVDSDTALPRGLPREPNTACREARVLEASPTRDRRGVRMRVEAPADCPLAVAMNFAETLRAETIGPEGPSGSALVFPACGALAGVWVPAGTREIVLDAH